MGNRPLTGPAPEHDELSARSLLERKLELLRDVLEMTRQELLLVDLDGLDSLLEGKEHLIAEIAAADSALEKLGVAAVELQAQQPFLGELERLVTTILDNERTLEIRLEDERERLKRDMRGLEREARLRGYLERQRPGSRKVDVTR